MSNEQENIIRSIINFGTRKTGIEHYDPTIKDFSFNGKISDISCVFIKVPDGFELRGVTLGDTDGEFVAITSGLKAGEIYATKNSFLLKAELDQSALSFHVHSDGTVHIEKKN